MSLFRSLVIASAFVSTGAFAQEPSTITVPFSASLLDLEAYSDSQLPVTLFEESRGQTCVEAQEACTKIPEFRGFKIYSRMQCVQVTPAIDCHLSQRAWRDGALNLSGQADALTLQQTVRGTATVRGRGDIGRHIRETANGVAQLTISARPRVNPDWSLSAPIEHHVHWLEAPNVVLFNILRVTFRTQADEAINSAVNTFKTQTLPQELAKIDLRERASLLWVQLQAPQKIELPAGPELYLHFRPETVGIAPLSVADGRVDTTISITGQTQVTDSKQSPFSNGATSLPNLSAVPEVPDFSLVFPVSVGLEALSAVLAAELPLTLAFEDPMSGTFTINSGSFAEQKDRLLLHLDVKVMASGFNPYDGPMTLSGVPHWDAQSEVFSLREPMLEIDTTGPIAFLLAQVLNNGAMQNWLEQQAYIPLGPEIKKLEAPMQSALNRPLAPGLQLRGDVALSITDLTLDSGVHLTVRADGSASVEGLVLR